MAIWRIALALTLAASARAILPDFSATAPPLCFTENHLGRLNIDLGEEGDHPFLTEKGIRGAFVKVKKEPGCTGSDCSTEVIGNAGAGDESVCLAKGQDTVRFDVWESKILGNEQLGYFDILVSELSETAPTDKKYNIMKDGKDTGDQLRLVLTFFPSRYLCEFYDDLESGDVVLFSGASWKGEGIKFFTGAEFSHIGLVYRVPGDPTLYLLESSTNGAMLQDCTTNKSTTGTELLSLRDKVYSGSYGEVAFRKLEGMTSAQRADLHQSLSSFYEKYKGQGYPDIYGKPEDFYEFAGTIMKWNYKEDDSTMFCSEFVALAFREAGINKPEFNDVYTNNFKPSDYESHGSRATGTTGDRDYGQKLKYKLSSEIYMRQPQLFGMQEAIPKGESPSSPDWAKVPQCSYRKDKFAGCQCGAGVTRASQKGIGPKCDSSNKPLPMPSPVSPPQSSPSSTSETTSSNKPLPTSSPVSTSETASDASLSKGLTAMAAPVAAVSLLLLGI